MLQENPNRLFHQPNRNRKAAPWGQVQKEPTQAESSCVASDTRLSCRNVTQRKQRGGESSEVSHLTFLSLSHFICTMVIEPILVARQDQMRQ